MSAALRHSCCQPLPGAWAGGRRGPAASYKGWAVLRRHVPRFAPRAAPGNLLRGNGRGGRTILGLGPW
eukprot:4827480-Alexandrium_andersonii.AAC.1